MISGHDSSPLFAVGSLSHLMLIDDRDPNTTDITSVKILEPAQGIRYVISLKLLVFNYWYSFQEFGVVYDRMECVEYQMNVILQVVIVSRRHHYDRSM